MKKLFSLCAIVALAGCNSKPSETTAIELPKGVTAIEQVAPSADGTNISYSKYVLDNGLTVVLHEDKSDPLVDVDVTYHVGSSREQLGYSGFAHFFEHMMFQGSQNVADEEHFGIITEAGGTLNGTTNSDRTNYFNTAPSNQLGTLLWLEADRMGFLLDAITEESFEVQRETVKNERGQRVDNRPYGRLWETMAMHLYPAGHPYSWPVIGHMEDLNRAEVSAVKQFFLRWYGPNNATLTIGGDIDAEETLQQVVKYFGSIPAGPEVTNMAPQPVTLDSDRYVTIEDNIYMPALAITIPTVYRFHEDEAALDAAAKIIGQGATSMLHESLIQTGRALSANLSHSCAELACTMTAIVVQNRNTGESLADLEKTVREALAEFAERGVSEDELARFKAQIERSQIYGLQSVSGKVRQLAYYQTFLGTPDGMSQEIKTYQAVTTQDISDAFNKYVADKPAVVVSVVPKGMLTLAAAEDNHEVTPTTPEEPLAGLELRPATDSFDRSKRPTATVAKSVSLPAIWEETLSNGVKVYGVNNTETPTTRVEVLFNAGQRDLTNGQEGLTTFVNSVINEATTEHSLAELRAMEERLSASAHIDIGDYFTSASLSVLSKNLTPSIDILMEKMLKPGFNEQDVERIRGELIQQIQQQKTSGPALANDAVEQVLGDSSNPLSQPSLGSSENIAKFSKDDLKAFYTQFIPSKVASILVSSSLPKEDILAALEPLSELDADATARSFSKLHWEAPQSSGIFFMHKPKAAQSSLRIVANGPLWDIDGEFYKAQLMNFNLGGNFNSRINQNLREDKGFTYGARSYFSGSEEEGSFMVSAEVRADSTLASIQEILIELDRVSTEGLSEEEVAFMKSAYSQRDARAYETPAQKLGLIRRLASYGVSADYLKKREEAMKSTSVDELNAIAKKLIDTEQLAIIIVGDRDLVMDDLKKLDLPITELQFRE